MSVSLSLVAHWTSSNRTLNHFGVGEVVTLTATATSGTPTFSWRVDGAAYVRQEVSGNRLHLRFKDGPGKVTVSCRASTEKHKALSSWADAKIVLTVCVPTGGALHTPYATGAQGMTVAAAGFRAVFLMCNPHKVRFDNLEAKEDKPNAATELTGAMPSEASGSLKGKKQERHVFGAGWLKVGVERKNILDVSNHARWSGGTIPDDWVPWALDRVATGVYAPDNLTTTGGLKDPARPFKKSGEFLWKIPWYWRLRSTWSSTDDDLADCPTDLSGAQLTTLAAIFGVADNPARKFAVVKHKEVLNADGTITVSKGGRSHTNDYKVAGDWSTM
jgi:hypothetical protein